jgi:type III secretory pathway lipoprotein EscJ
MVSIKISLLLSVLFICLISTCKANLNSNIDVDNSNNHLNNNNLNSQKDIKDNLNLSDKAGKI